MPAVFHFIRITAPGAPLYQVRLESMSGPLLGTVTDEAAGWCASVLKAEKLNIRRFVDRDEAAAWLLTLSPWARAEKKPPAPSIPRRPSRRVASE